jgi:DNA gyrase/topoisomerase IV subunit B
MTFIYRHMPQLITAGRVYLAQPPLYRIDIGKETYWALDDAHKERLLKSHGNGRAQSRDHALQGPRRDDAEGAVGDDDEPADAAPAARRHRRSDRHRLA